MYFTSTTPENFKDSLNKMSIPNIVCHTIYAKLSEWNSNAPALVLPVVVVERKKSGTRKRKQIEDDSFDSINTNDDEQGSDREEEGEEGLEEDNDWEDEETKYDLYD